MGILCLSLLLQNSENVGLRDNPKPCFSLRIHVLSQGTIGIDSHLRQRYKSCAFPPRHQYPAKEKVIPFESFRLNLVRSSINIPK